MDTAHSTPPLSPIRQYVMSPLDTSPSPTRSSYREHLRRRTSSFSSNHDRSPTTPKSHHRFSNASQLSVEFPSDERGADGGGGLGNLADELDQLEDDDEQSEDGANDDEPLVDGEEQSRDSGIDVSYATGSKPTASGSQHVRNFSKPFSGTGSEGDRPADGTQRPASSEDADGEDKFSAEIEDLMTTIARITSYTSTLEDPLVPRTITHLQDLGNQTSLEAGAHRLITGTNSLTSHLNNQAKSLQTLAQSLYPMFAGFSAPLDPDMVDDVVPQLDMLKDSIPHPDIVAGQKLQKLERETTELVSTLSQLTDTLQMGKQITNSAARHLRTTQTIVEGLRREREQAETARHELTQSGWGEKLESRWCGAQCSDIITGFEARYDTLRGELELAVDASA
ncbi:hypothetical protein Slin14017_G006310 [Septoria linicola]|nr:hypothetical protein Slin14017_G006310 [Septoria linicola]